MKRTLLLIASGILPLCMSAQITLSNSTNAPTSVLILGHDYNIVKIGGNTNTFPAAASSTWDLTTFADSSTFGTTHGTASNPAFPNATFTILKFYPFASGLTYEFTSMLAMNNTGYLSYGEHMERQALPLGAVTMNNNDSLVFLKQDVVYNNSGKVYLKYPVTYKSAWSSVAKYNTDFTLSVAAYGLNKTPGQRRTAFTIQDTVIGWGKMRVNTKTGTASGYMDVLQVEEVETVADSFFLGGSPAPAPLLTAFGLSQGQQSKRYFRKFYRANEAAPLAEIEYTDVAFTKIKYLRVHKDGLATTTIIAVDAGKRINIFPNPVTNYSFTINIPGRNNGIYSYSLVNNIGQKIAEGSIPDNGQITLPSSIVSGRYYLQVNKNNEQMGVKQLQILN